MADRADQDYTPRKVAHYLSIWPELLEKATPTARSSSRFSWEAGATNDADALYAVCIIADIERAWSRLHRWSLEHQMVEWSMKRPLSVDHKDYIVMVAKALRVNVGTANESFDDACEAIAMNLGWRG